MKRYIFIFILLCYSFTSLRGQNFTAEQFGFRHIFYKYNSEGVDILIKSKEGEKFKKKPLFFFCQGSLPKPLIKYSDGGNHIYSVFPFSPDSIINDYHLVIVSKPFIPLIYDAEKLGKGLVYLDEKGHFPKEYSNRNYLDYYVERNIKIIEYLQSLNWVSNYKTVVCGHSEGSTIAAKMAFVSQYITHLIYSGGNPMGSIVTMIQQQRAEETDTDSTRYAEDEIKYWEQVVADKTSFDNSQGDTNKGTYDFSTPPPIEYLEKLQIPVLVCYGTKDWGAPYVDYLRVDVIRKDLKNFNFIPYIGTDHNFFPLTSDNKPDYSVFNWDKVASDWLLWLKDN